MYFIMKYILMKTNFILILTECYSGVTCIIHVDSKFDILMVNTVTKIKYML